MTAPGIHEAKRDGGFAWAEDTPDADRECGKTRRLYKQQCMACRRAVMLHCDLCKIQVTGCLCTLVERMEPVEAYRLLASQVGQVTAHQEFARFGYTMPLLPDIPL